MNETCIVESREVSERLEGLGDQVCHYEAVLSNLDDKLSFVLSNPQPIEELKRGNKAATCEVSGRILELETRVEIANNSLADIISRIQC